jgi:hypothetical protein
VSPSKHSLPSSARPANYRTPGLVAAASRWEYTDDCRRSAAIHVGGKQKVKQNIMRPMASSEDDFDLPGQASDLQLIIDSALR